MISINLYEIIMQMINFLILLYLLNRFMVKPLSKFVEKRSSDIKQDIESAKASKDSAEKHLSEQKQLLLDARVEAKTFRQQAEDVIKKERERVLSDTKKEAETLLLNARKEVDLSIVKAKKELLSEVGDLAVSLAESILHKKLDHKDKESVLSDSIQKFSVS